MSAALALRCVRHGSVALLPALLLVAPRLAAACPVCRPGDGDPAQLGFLMGTIFLSLLPLALVGGAVLWLRHRIRRLAAEESAATAPPQARWAPHR